jgi:multidrug resistance protein
MASRGAPKQLWVLMATVFVDMIGLLMVLPLLPYYARDFDAGGLAVGLLTAIFAAAQLLSAPFWGRFSDRYGRRPIILAGLLASAAGYLVFGVAQALWMLFATRLLQGLGAGTIGVVQAYVSDSVEPRERSKAFGWLSAAASAGVMVGPLVGSFSSEYLGPQGPGFFAAGLCLVNVAFAWRLLPEPEKSSSPAAKRSILRSLGDVFAHPALPTSSMIWIYALAMMASSVMQTVLALYLMDRFAITERDIGWFYTYVGGVSVVMRAALLGRILDTFGESRTMRMGALAMALGFFLIPVAPSLLLFVPATTLIPVGTAMLFPTCTSRLTQSAPAGEVGQLLGVQLSFRGIAGILGPAWAGAAYEFVNIRSPLLAGGVVMALVFFVTLRVTDQEEEAPSPAAPEVPGAEVL